MTKGYIFDYGGTLDTAGCHWGKVLWYAYQRQHVPVSEKDFREAYVFGERTLGGNTIIKPIFSFHKTLEIKIRLEMEHLCTKGVWNASEEDFHEMHQAVLNDVYKQVVGNAKHSLKVLRRLKKDYPMVLVSNFYGNINEVLKEFGFDEIFDKVIESAVVGIRKPDPRIFALGVEALGMKAEEVVVVGDSFYKDIEPAIKVGCQTIWFKGEGWNDVLYDESIPDRIITDLDQI